jgi:hypothetical protein
MEPLGARRQREVMHQVRDSVCHGVDVISEGFSVQLPNRTVLCCEESKSALNNRLLECRSSGYQINRLDQGLVLNDKLLVCLNCLNFDPETFGCGPSPRKDKSGEASSRTATLAPLCWASSANATHVFHVYYEIANVRERYSKPNLALPHIGNLVVLAKSFAAGQWLQNRAKIGRGSIPSVTRHFCSTAGWIGRQRLRTERGLSSRSLANVPLKFLPEVVRARPSGSVWSQVRGNYAPDGFGEVQGSRAQHKLQMVSTANRWTHTAGSLGPDGYGLA